GFFRRFYVASNMRLAYVGPKVDKGLFNSFSGIAAGKSHKSFPDPAGFSGRNVMSRPIGQCYLVLGKKTVPRRHPDSFVLDVIRAVLGKGLTGRIVNEVRQEKGLAYEVGCVNECDIDYGFFSVYLSTKNLALAESIVRKHLADIGSVSDKEILEAKYYCVGEFVRETEDSRVLADILAFWDCCNMDSDVGRYVKSIRDVTKCDVLRVAKKYFSGPFAVAVLKEN
ncbi:MAG: insulinase family protein, partial [Candidatus Woesearchaeota archaeon]